MADGTRNQQEQKKFEADIKNLVSNYLKSNQQEIGELRKEMDNKINGVQAELDEVKKALNDILAKLSENPREQISESASTSRQRTPAMGSNDEILGPGPQINSHPDSVSVPTPTFINRQKSVVNDYEPRKLDHDGGRSRFGRVDFPCFDGTGNLKVWICQANQYFAINRTPLEDKSQTASLYLRDDAVLWMYSYIEDKGVWPPWEIFSNDLCLRFDPSANRMPIAEWRSVVQTGSVTNYQLEFEKAIIKANCSESLAVEMFVRGLKEEF